MISEEITWRRNEKTDEWSIYHVPAVNAGVPRLLICTSNLTFLNSYWLLRFHFTVRKTIGWTIFLKCVVISAANGTMFVKKHQCVWIPIFMFILRNSIPFLTLFPYIRELDYSIFMFDMSLIAKKMGSGVAWGFISKLRIEWQRVLIQMRRLIMIRFT